MAPEIIEKKADGIQIDWWALGILTYELFFGTTLFRHPNSNELIHLITTSSPTFPDDCEPKIKNFILSLLEKNPEKRLTFKELLVHPFFDGLNFEDVYNKKIIPEFIPILSSTDVINTSTLENEQTNATFDSLATPMDSIGNAQFKGFSYFDAEEDESSDVQIEDDLPRDPKLEPTSFTDLPHLI